MTDRPPVEAGGVLEESHFWVKTGRRCRSGTAGLFASDQGLRVRELLARWSYLRSDDRFNTRRVARLASVYTETSWATPPRQPFCSRSTDQSHPASSLPATSSSCCIRSRVIAETCLGPTLRLGTEAKEHWRAKPLASGTRRKRCGLLAINLGQFVTDSEIAYSFHAINQVQAIVAPR